jgi:hypothetical protein
MYKVLELMREIIGIKKEGVAELQVRPNLSQQDN